MSSFILIASITTTNEAEAEVTIVAAIAAASEVAPEAVTAVLKVDIAVATAVLEVDIAAGTEQDIAANIVEDLIIIMTIITAVVVITLLSVAASTATKDRVVKFAVRKVVTFRSTLLISNRKNTAHSLPCMR